MYEQARYLPAGDKGLVVEFGNSISPEINYKVRSFSFALEQAGLSGIVEYIPTYRSLLILYDPLVWHPDLLVARFQELERSLSTVKLPQHNVYYLPVVYGGEMGPDFPSVCRHTGLTRNDLIKAHTDTTYLVYMLGFTPGFIYLGGMDERIATPRLDNPRLSVPAGSVGIAGNQTGIYPAESPGGWRIIGRTPVKLFQPLSSKPVLINAGDHVCFIEVTLEEYHELTGQIERGEYNIKKSQIMAKEG